MDDWSLLPSRNAASEPAPNPPSPMTNTPTPARLTRPRQAPKAGVDHPRPQNTALDPTGLARQPRNQSGAKPQTPTITGPHDHATSRQTARTSTTVSQPLDTSRPFMDDTGRLHSPLRAIPSQLRRRPGLRAESGEGRRRRGRTEPGAGGRWPCCRCLPSAGGEVRTRGRAAGVRWFHPARDCDRASSERV